MAFAPAGSGYRLGTGRRGGWLRFTAILTILLVGLLRDWSLLAQHARHSPPAGTVSRQEEPALIDRPALAGQPELMLLPSSSSGGGGKHPAAAGGARGTGSKEAIERQVAVPADGGRSGPAAQATEGGTAEAVQPAGSSTGETDAGRDGREQAGRRKANPAGSSPGGSSSGGGGSAAPATGGLPCEVSGYCSLGRVQVWSGDITSNEALREMLAAVSFKKEVIFTTSDMSNPLQQQLSINVLRSSEALGYGHAFLLASDQAACDKVPAQFRSSMSCVWDSREIVQSEPAADIMYRRWELLARMVRMGYNALSLDTDAMLVDDVYRYLKHPVFAGYNALFQDDGGSVNCGVMYFQNCHPSGPAAWMAVEHVDRTNRQREGEEHMQSVYAGWNFDWTWDQVMWDDALSSVTAGRPVTLIGNEHLEAGWREENEQYNYYSRREETEVAWPAEWYKHTAIEAGIIARVEALQLPVVEDSWWQEHSAYFYPPERGHVSTAVLELLRSASDLPLFEVGKPWQDPPGVPPEHFAFLPTTWMVGTYADRAAHGFWATDPPATVITHNVYLPTHFPDWKMYTFKGFGWWHWEVTEAFTGNNVLGLPDPKLLMLAPGVQLFTDTEDEFREEGGKLARLAELLGRKLVFPNPPCDSRWLGVYRNSYWQATTTLQLWPYYYDGGQVMQFPDSQRPGNHTYCHWLRALEPKCNALMPAYADVAAFLDRAADRDQMAPVPGNTLWHAEWQASGGGEGPPAGAPAAPPMRLADAAALVEAAGQLADVAVLFLGALPQLDSLTTLPPLPPAYRECYLYNPAAGHLEGAPEGQINRAKLLNGTLER